MRHPLTASIRRQISLVTGGEPVDVVGIGFAGVFMPGLKALSDRIEEHRQSRAVAMYTSLSGIGLGTVLSPESVTIDTFRKLRDMHAAHASTNGKAATPIQVVASPTVAAARTIRLLFLVWAPQSLL